MGVDSCQDIKSGAVHPKCQKEQSGPTDRGEGGRQAYATYRAIYRALFFTHVDLLRHSGIPRKGPQRVDPEESLRARNENMIFAQR